MSEEDSSLFHKGFRDSANCLAAHACTNTIAVILNQPCAFSKCVLQPPPTWQHKCKWSSISSDGHPLSSEEMTKWYPQKADSWRVVEITDSCLAGSLIFAAVLTACQEPSACRTCRLTAARPGIVQDDKSSVREASRPSLFKFLLLGFIALLQFCQLPGAGRFKQWFPD